MEIRRATQDDIPLMITLRKRQLMDEGQSAHCNIDAELEAFFTEGLRAGTLVEWLAEEAGEVIGTSGVCFYRLPPSYTKARGRVAYITNMYTAPAHRGRGVGRQLLHKAVECAREAECSTVRLFASEKGRPLYAKYGFDAVDNAMVLRL